jgi:hypothetical protein
VKDLFKQVMDEFYWDTAAHFLVEMLTIAGRRIARRRRLTDFIKERRLPTSRVERRLYMRNCMIPPAPQANSRCQFREWCYLRDNDLSGARVWFKLTALFRCRSCDLFTYRRQAELMA